MAVLRITALMTGISLLLHLVSSHTSRLIMTGAGPARNDELVTAAYWALVAGALIQLPACLSRRASIYRITMALGGGIYLLMLATDVVLSLFQGSSPLSPVHLGDYCGIPAIMLAAALGPPVGFILALLMSAAAAIVNNHADTLMLQLLSVGHGWIVPLPFFVAFTLARSTARKLDTRISRVHRDTLREIRSRELRETETHFLAHIHDTVLTLLRAVASGALPPDKDVILSHLSPAEISAGDAEIPVADAFREVHDVVEKSAPGTGITATGELPTSGGGIPARAVAAICGALAEAALNSRRHALTNERNCTISCAATDGEISGFRVDFTDEGVGFDPDTVPGNRAGVRVSITGRVSDTPGCSVDLRSAPGSGTRVTLCWRREPGDPVEPGNETNQPALPPLFRLIGMYITHSPWFALATVAVFTGLSVVDESCAHGPAWVLGILALATSVFAVTSGTSEKLRPIPTVVVVLGVITMIVAGVFTGTSVISGWPAGWWAFAVQVPLPLLAIRCRARVALATLFVCTAILRVLEVAGFATPGDATVILMFGATIIAGSLVPLLVRRATAGIPVAVEASRMRSVGLSRDTARSSYLGESCRWVGGLVRVILDESRPEADRRRDSRLLELRLRDSIRSPLLDRTALNRAVWFARSRGVRIALLDERSESSPRCRGTGGDPPSQATALDMVRSAAAEIIDAAVEGQVTVRLLPEGRTNLATVVSEARGEVHYVTYDHEGRATTRRIRSGD